MDELNSVILKFRHLWRYGQDAYLDMECHAGQAWVGIHVQLGQEVGLQIPKSRNRNTPSGEQDQHAEEAVVQEYYLAEEAHENVLRFMKSQQTST